MLEPTNKKGSIKQLQNKEALICVFDCYEALLRACFFGSLYNAKIRQEQSRGRKNLERPIDCYKGI